MIHLTVKFFLWDCFNFTFSVGNKYSMKECSWLFGISLWWYADWPTNLSEVTKFQEWWYCVVLQFNLCAFCRDQIINQSIKFLWRSQAQWRDSRIGIQQQNQWSSSVASMGQRACRCLWAKGQVKESCLQMFLGGSNWSGWTGRQREVVHILSCIDIILPCTSVMLFRNRWCLLQTWHYLVQTW